MSENNTFNNLNLILTKDNGEDQQITLNTLNKVGLSLDYNKLTSAKTFALNEDGITYTSGTTSFNTPLERLCALKTALSAVELPTDTTTLALNKNIQLNQTSDNNVIMETHSNNLLVPYPGVDSDFQSRLTKQSTNNIELAHINDLQIRKNVRPVNTLDLTYTQVTTPTNLSFNASGGTSTSALFPVNNKLIYSSYLTNFNKILYLESYTTPGTFTTINITTLTTGSANYSADLASISIAQIIPVYYNSATDCKFYIRLGKNSTDNNIYIITCVGDPTLLTSYTYSTNYLTCSDAGVVPIANTFANGVPCLTSGDIPPILNGQVCSGARAGILYYDSVADLFVLANYGGATLANMYYSVVNPSLTKAGVYQYALPTGYNNINSSVISSTYTTPCLTRIFNNNNIGGFKGQYQNLYWDTTTKTLSRSPYFDICTAIPKSYFYNNSTFDSYSISVGNLIYTYLPIRVQITAGSTTNGQDLYVGCVSWDKTITTTPSLIFCKYIESAGTSLFYSVSNYPSLYVRNTNNIQLFSTYSANFYITTDAFTTMSTYNQPSFKGTNVEFVGADQSCIQITNKMSTNYDIHAIWGGNLSNTFNKLTRFSVSNPSIQSAQTYLTLDYDLTTNEGSISSTKPLTLSANPLTVTSANFTDLPTCSVVPTLGNQLVNKTYVDSMPSSTPALSSVLAVGNSTGGLNIDVNSNDLLNVNSITSSGDLILNPVGSIDCNGKNINLTGGEIHNCDLIHSQNNTNILIEGKGTGEINFQTGANAFPCVNINNNGTTTFVIDAPICDIAPIASNRLVSKGYVDGAITTASSSYVKTTGNETIGGIKTFSEVPKCSTLPSVSNDLVNKDYFDGNAVLKTGAQTITGDKTFSGTTSLSGATTISGQAQVLKLIEQTRTPNVAGTVVSFDYSLNAGMVVYLASPPSTNYSLEITNFPTNTYPNGSITFSILSNTTTSKTYANSLKLNGSATSETILYNGGSAGISITTASFVLQTFTVVYSSTNKICVLSSVCPWLA